MDELLPGAGVMIPYHTEVSPPRVGQEVDLVALFDRSSY